MPSYIEKTITKVAFYSYNSAVASTLTHLQVIHNARRGARRHITPSIQSAPRLLGFGLASQNQATMAVSLECARLQLQDIDMFATGQRPTRGRLGNDLTTS